VVRENKSWQKKTARKTTKEMQHTTTGVVHHMQCRDEPKKMDFALAVV